MSRQEIKIVNRRGQVTLGKQYAGHQVTVQETGPGVWVIRLIPDNERWLHEPEVRAKLDRAIAWAEANPPRETDLDELEKKIIGDR